MSKKRNGEPMTFGGTFKWVVIIVVIILAILVVIPLILQVAGVNFSFFGRKGSGFSSEILFRSTNGGADWQPLKITAPARLKAPSNILEVSFHPQDPELVFFGTKSSSIWKSTDAGKNWTQMTDASRVLDSAADVYKIRISIADPKVMYVAVFQESRGRVLKSEDGGLSFREVFFTGAERRLVSDIFLDPSNANHLIIATSEGGILESDNGGKTWRFKRLFTEGIARLAVNPSFTNEIYAVTESGNVFKTFDGGENWADLTDAIRNVEGKQVVEGAVTNFGFSSPFSFSRNSAGVLALSPKNSNLIYFGSDTGLFRSSTGGLTWEEADILIPKEVLPVGAVSIHPRDDQIIFVAASNQLYQSTNGGKDWVRSLLPTKLRLNGIFINPVRPDLMFAIGG